MGVDSCEKKGGEWVWQNKAEEKEEARNCHLSVVNIRGKKHEDIKKLRTF